MTVGQLINELHALAKDDKNMYAAQVNVTVRYTHNDNLMSQDIEVDGPAELVEKVFLPEGPAVRIISRNGSEV